MTCFLTSFWQDYVGRRLKQQMTVYRYNLGECDCYGELRGKGNYIEVVSCGLTFSGLQTGQTPLSIAERLGYVSVVQALKTITETTVITETTTVTEERYKPQSPEAMNETIFTDSEDEGNYYLYYF